MEGRGSEEGEKRKKDEKKRSQMGRKERKCNKQCVGKRRSEKERRRRRLRGDRDEEMSGEGRADEETERQTEE